MLLYFHGGAFVLCRARTERMIVGNLAAWYLEAVAGQWAAKVLDQDG